MARPGIMILGVGVVLVGVTAGALGLSKVEPKALGAPQPMRIVDRLAPRADGMPMIEIQVPAGHGLTLATETYFYPTEATHACVIPSTGRWTGITGYRLTALERCEPSETS